LGAASNRYYNLSRALLETNNVSVICPLPNYPTGSIFKGYKYKKLKSEILDKIKVYRHFIYPTTSKRFILRGFGMLSFSLSIWLILFRWKLLKSAELIIVQNSPLLVSFSSIILFKKIFKKKLVLNVSDIKPDSAKTLGAISSNSKIYKLLKKIEIFNYTNSTVIVGQSNEIINHVSNYVNCPTFLLRQLADGANIAGRDKEGATVLHHAAPSIAWTDGGCHPSRCRKQGGEAWVWGERCRKQGAVHTTACKSPDVVD